MGVAMIHVCAYCGKPTQLVGGDVIYPHRPDLADKLFYRCVLCEAHVGCHPGTTEPLGRVANAELRKAKMAAHAAFDPLWRGGGMKRKEAYAWLRTAMGLVEEDCHIGMFNVEQCHEVVRLCEEWGHVPKG